MITTGLSPNVERDDITLALTTILQPWRWRRGSAEQGLINALQNYFSTDSVWPVNAGRTALLLVLQSLHLTAADEVLLQAFTCNAVANPILWSGAKPVYVDIEANTLNMSLSDLTKKITSHSKVLIIQHTFGLPANIEALLSIARQHKLYVIEDCAHALGAKHNDQLLGTFGHAAIFSFGRDKVISSVYGGALLVQDKNFTLPALPYPSIFWTKQQLLHPLITAAAKKMRWLLPIAQTLKLISLAVSAQERRGEQPSYFPARLPNGLASLALHQLSKLDRYNQHRRTIAAYYHQQLTQPRWFADSIYLRYSVRVSDRPAVLAAAKQQGIILGDWYDAPVVPTAIGYMSGSCPVAEAVSHEIINLPTHIGIRTKEANRIIQFMKPYVDGSN